MSHFYCTCGERISDTSDFISNKAWVIADQDFERFFELIRSGKDNYSKYLRDMFQCPSCSRLVFFKQSEGFFFTPDDPEKNKELLLSYHGKKWKGFLRANYNEGKGYVYWYTNLENGYRENLSRDEMRELYYRKFEELKKLDVLANGFLAIEGKTEHQYEDENLLL